MHFDLTEFIKAAGYFGVFGFIFAESGLFIGFFLPGDSLLFTAGFLASNGFLDIWVLVLGSFIAAVAGVNVGYAFGKKVGPALFNKKDSLLFSQENVRKAREFYDRHGKKTLILARFMPIVRTFVPILAGVGQMHYRTFLLYNVIGGLLWAVGLTCLGYFLGAAIPDVDRYLLPIVAFIILVSILPGVVHILKSRQFQDKLRAPRGKR